MADTKISALTDAGTIVGTEELPVVQGGVTKRVTVSELGTVLQPLDADLTAIAALTTTAYGRTLLTVANLAALQAILGTTGTPSATTFLRGDGSWQTPSGGGGGDLLAANNLSDVANAGTARTNLGLAIGTDVQAFDTDLTAIAALVSAADKLLYSTGAGTWALADLTTFARTLLDDTDAATMRTTLGLAIGTNVQAYDAELAALAGLTSAANKIPYFTGSGTAALLDFKDEDNMVSDSATALPSQQSVKAYVDANAGGGGSDLPTLTAATSVATGDLFYTVVDPGGTPLDRKITAGNLAASISTLLSISALPTLGETYAISNGAFLS